MSEKRIHLVVSITRPDGAEVSPRHAAVIAKAAAMMMATINGPGHSTDDEASHVWAKQGRAMISASHAVASRPIQPHAVGTWGKAPQYSSAERRAR